jgi:uncharacterized protein with PhoU and TrkA domain
VIRQGDVLLLVGEKTAMDKLEQAWDHD